MSDNNISINVTRSSMPDFDEYCSEIRDIWDSRWLTNFGPKHQELTKQLVDMLGVKHVSLFTNGHLALEDAIAVFEFPEGSEVITTPFTFASTTHAISRNGLVPVFCDIKEDDFTMDPAKIEALITDRTVAIVPVHVYGNMCDVEAIDAIARKYNLKVIYDAAHAFGVTYKGRSSAVFGDISMYSFHATKVFNSIEGGACCFDNDDYLEKMESIKNFGIKIPFQYLYTGGNAKMNEFQAAMGICNLRHLSGEIAKRRAVAERYDSLLGGVTGLRIKAPKEDVVPNYAYYPVIFDGYKYNRDEAAELLAAEGIFARKYFYPVTNSYECYSSLKNSGPETTPVATYMADRVLTLPMYADLSIQDVEKICGIIL